jgi:hypothetical protein
MPSCVRFIEKTMPVLTVQRLLVERTSVFRTGSLAGGTTADSSSQKFISDSAIIATYYEIDELYDSQF